MELPDRIKESVCRVAICSSTKNCLVETDSSRNSINKHRSVRKSRQPDSEPSDSHQSDKPREFQPMATSKNGVGTSRILEDINEEVKQELSRSNLQIPYPRVRFDDILVFIESERKVNEYDIIQDIKDQKANVTIGQLLYDNTNYQKLIRDAWTKRRKQRFKLPSVAIKFL